MHAETLQAVLLAFSGFLNTLQVVALAYIGAKYREANK